MVRKSRSNVHVPSQAEVLTRIRDYLFDTKLDEAEHISILIGSPSPSEEVLEMEFESSDERVDKVAHMIPLLYAYATTLANGMVEHQKAHIEDADMEPEQLEKAWEATRGLFTKVAFSNALATVSQLVYLGVVHLPTDNDTEGKKPWYKKLLTR